jgi:hypothetical protein
MPLLGFLLRPGYISALHLVYIRPMNHGAKETLLPDQHGIAHSPTLVGFSDSVPSKRGRISEEDTVGFEATASSKLQRLIQAFRKCCYRLFRQSECESR